MKNQKHFWADEEIQHVLDTVIMLANTDEQEVNAILAADVAVTKGAVKALRISLNRIANGFEPTPLSGGPGHNYGKNVKRAFDGWFAGHNRFTMRQLGNKL